MFREFKNNQIVMVMDFFFEYLACIGRKYSTDHKCISLTDFMGFFKNIVNRQNIYTTHNNFENKKAPRPTMENIENASITRHMCTRNFSSKRS